MAELRVDIASEFTGKKAFDKAAKATSSLDKAVGKLGRQLVSVFAVTKVVAFGKASVKAFLDDEAAATRLGKAVENLGLAFAQPQIDNYISKLEASSAVADDLLRPSFQALLTTTGSLTKSQELLTLAIETSRGSGVELSTVAQDLASAFVGNTKGLRKYNLGLTQAELKTMSFTEVQAKFNQQFSGANQSYLSTYAGQLNILTVAAGNAQEVIGQGLVDALVLAGGKTGDIQNVSDAMASLADYTADTVRGMGVLVGKITQLNEKVAGGALGKIISGGFNLGLIGLLRRLGDDAQERPRAGRRFMGGQQANLYSSQEAAQKKLARQQAELTKKQIAAQKKLTDEQKKQAALKKAGTIFDLEQIGIIAALQGNLSKEEKMRLEAQLALLNNNEAVATSLTKQILMSQDATGNLYKLWKDLPDAKNPFQYLEAYLDMLAGKIATTFSFDPNKLPPELRPQSTTSNVPTPAERNQIFGTTSNVPTAAERNQIFGTTPSRTASTYVGGTPIYVQIDGKTIASALQDSSLSGIGSSVNRTGR